MFTNIEEMEKTRFEYGIKLDTLMFSANLIDSRKTANYCIEQGYVVLNDTIIANYGYTVELDDFKKNILKISVSNNHTTIIKLI